MKHIPVHTLPDDKVFMMDRIEGSDESRYLHVHRHGFYELLWFTNIRRNEYHLIDTERYEIYPNQIFILSPGQLHQMPIGTKKGYVMAFSPDFFHHVLGLTVELMIKPYYFTDILSGETPAILEKITQLMEAEYKGANRKKIIEAYSTAFLFHIQPLFKRDLNGCPDKLVDVLKLVERHFAQEKEVLFYARKVSLSSRRLNEISVSTTGKTVKQLIIGRLITEAKRLIYIENLSLKEIAYQLGYNDPAYFSRIFKKKTGLTPEEFRSRTNKRLGE